MNLPKYWDTIEEIYKHFKVYESDGFLIESPDVVYKVNGVDFYGAAECIIHTLSMSGEDELAHHNFRVSQELKYDDYGKYEYYVSAGALAVASTAYYDPADRGVEGIIKRIYPKSIYSHRVSDISDICPYIQDMTVNIDEIEYEITEITRWQFDSDLDIFCDDDSRYIAFPSDLQYQDINSSIVVLKQKNPTQYQLSYSIDSIIPSIRRPLRPIYPYTDINDTCRFGFMLLCELLDMLVYRQTGVIN